MQDTNESVPRRKWIIWVAGIPLFLVVAYFVVTSGWFVRFVILPRAGDSLGATITAESVSLSPWTSFRAEGVRLVPKGAEPLLEVGALQVRYSLWSILRGTVAVDELLVERPVVTVTAKPGNASNLDAWLKTLPKSAPSKKAVRPPTLAIRNVNLKGGELRLDRDDGPGARFRAAFTGFDVSLDKLVSNEPIRTKLGASLEVESKGGVGDARASGRMEGEVVTLLNNDLGLDGVTGRVAWSLPEAAGAMEGLKGLGAILDVSMGTTAITNATLAFSQGGKPLGSVAVKGQVRLADSEVRLTYEVQGLSTRVLAVAGAAAGVDFGDAVATAAGRFDMLERGKLLATDGTLKVVGLSMGTARGRTTPINLEVQHRASLNSRTRSLLLDQLDVNVEQEGGAVLAASLDNSLNVSWDKATPAFRAATFTVKVAGLALQPWAPVLPFNAPQGLVNLTAKFGFDDAGRSCTLDLDLSGKALGATLGGRSYRNVGVTAKANARLADFERFNLDSLDVTLTTSGERLATIHGVADAHGSSRRVGLQFDLDVPIKPALSVYPLDGVSITDGQLRAGFMATLRGGLDQFDGDMTLALADVTGSVAHVKLANYHASVAATVGRTGSSVAIRKFSVTGQSGVDRGGAVECVGSYDITSHSGQANVKLIGVNESMLRPFVAQAIAPNRLVSLNLDMALRATLSKEGKATASGNASLGGFVMSHPDSRIPEVPLGLSLDFDASSDGRVTELRRVNVALEPTDRATNRIEVSALLDLGTNSPQPSRLSIKSTALDLTPIYDLLSSATNAVRPARASGEPQPVSLPFRQLTADLDIPRIFLHEIDVSDIRAKAAVQDNVATLDELGLRINDAPVQAKAKVDLRRPGYDYAASLSTAPIPIAPILNSFFPAMRQLARGSVLASADVRGAGVTGLSLKKSLAGHVEFRATNADVRLPDEPIKLPALLTRYIPLLPATIHPAAILSLIGKSSAMAEPFRVMEARANMGDGVIQIANARFMSAAMGLQAGGDVRIADILDQSTLNLPISLAFASGGSLPSLRTVGTVVGTIEKPSFKPDVLGLTAVAGSLTLPGVGNLGTKATDALKAAGGNLNQATGNALNKAGAAVEAVVGKDPKSPGNALGGLIKGVLPPGANPTNPAAKPDTNAPPKPGILDLLPGGKGQK
ncbi:MAG: hypothetical protein ACKOEQ_18385 [Verrucomicrobiota bacterium]